MDSMLKKPYKGLYALKIQPTNLFLLDELCKLNLLFSSLPIWAYIFSSIIKTLC